MSLNTSSTTSAIEPFSATWLKTLEAVASRTITLSGAVTGSGLTGTTIATTLSGSIDVTKLADGSISNTEFQYLNNVSSNIQTQLDGKVAANASITGATKTKITYDAKGLVTAGADATTADISDSTNKRYVTDADLTKLGNLSGTNTGDQTITLTGDVTGSGTGSFATTIGSLKVTNAMLAGSIENAKLTNSSVTVNGTAISLGSSGTVTANTPNSFVLKFDSGTTEGTDLYTFNGGSSKTVNIVAGSNITLTETAGQVTIAASSSSGVTGSGTAGRVAYWDGTSSISSAAEFTYDSTNADLTVDIAKLGAVSGYAMFAHSSNFDLSNYGFLQDSSGTTYVNAKSGQSIRFRLNNSDTNGMTFDGTYWTIWYDSSNKMTMNCSSTGVFNFVAYSGTSAQKFIFNADIETTKVTTRSSPAYDAVIVSGRAGGTGTYSATITPATLSASRTITIPDTTGTIVTTGDTGTVTNTMLAGSIALTKLTSDTTTALGVGTLELGHASDTTLSRSSAGVLAVEGVVVPTVSSVNSFTNKSLDDTTTTFFNKNDNTKKFVFSAASIATATTRTLTVPNVDGTIVTTGDTGTVTNTMLAGSITNAKLTNSSITVNGTSIALGASGTVTANTTNALTIGTGLSGTSFNGSGAVTIAIDSTVATLTGTQTFTNKSLSDSTTTFIDDVDNTKKMQFQLSGITTATTRTLTVPNVDGTIVTTGDTGSVTNTMLAGSIANAKLANSSITVNGSAISLGGSATVTANTTNALTIGTGLSGTSFNGSAAVTIAIDSTVATLSGTQTLTNKSLTDASTTFIDDVDATKKMQFQLSGITTATTRTLTVPNVDGTIVTTGDTGSVTNTMLAGSIANAKLTNSSVTIGSTSISLGGTSTTLAGLTSVTSIGTGGNQLTVGYDSTNKFNFNIGSDGVIYTDCMGTQGYMVLRHANTSYAGVRIGLWTEATSVSDRFMIAHNGLTHTGSTYGNYALWQTNLGQTSVNASSGQNLLLCNNNTTILTVNSTGAFGKIIPKINSTVTANTITPNADTDNMVSATGLTAGITLANHTGTPQDGQRLMVRFKDNGTSRTIAYGTAYVNGGVTRPTATTAGKWMHLGFIYNSTDSNWKLIASAVEA